MKLAKDVWEKIKQLDRAVRPVVYAVDAKGKEIKFPMRKDRGAVGKKTKRLRVNSKKGPGVGMTNHERVVFLRSQRLGISVEEYRRRFQGGR